MLALKLTDTSAVLNLQDSLACYWSLLVIAIASLFVTEKKKTRGPKMIQSD